MEEKEGEKAWQEGESEVERPGREKGDCGRNGECGEQGVPVRGRRMRDDDDDDVNDMPLTSAICAADSRVVRGISFIQR